MALLVCFVGICGDWVGDTVNSRKHRAWKSRRPAFKSPCQGFLLGTSYITSLRLGFPEWKMGIMTPTSFIPGGARRVMWALSQDCFPSFIRVPQHSQRHRLLMVGSAHSNRSGLYCQKKFVYLIFISIRLWDTLNTLVTENWYTRRQFRANCGPSRWADTVTDDHGRAEFLCGPWKPRMEWADTRSRVRADFGHSDLAWTSAGREARDRGFPSMCFWPWKTKVTCTLNFVFTALYLCIYTRWEKAICRL